ncbi:hypothetical protein [Halioglobus sp. Uisw_031]|uniref:hypothetical protein n=1 Tax=Halioglobus sp. Uisw_031 TaxID=3230977 RepID=UPI0039EA9723
MRNRLEDDCGISAQVADALQVPEIEHVLKLLNDREDSVEGQEKYTELKNGQLEDSFSNAADCWQQYRWHIFEAARILRLTGQRITVTEENDPRRYPWLEQTHLVFTED